MVLGHSVKSYKHMMRNMISSLIIHDAIFTTSGKAKKLAIAANKLIKFAKRAERGGTSALNLLKGRLYTDLAMQKLLKQTVPRLQNIPQNYLRLIRASKRRRGDNAPMVTVVIRGSQKDESLRMQVKQAKQSNQIVDSKAFCRKIWGEEKAYYEQLAKKHPQKAQFLRKKIAIAQFDLWALDKARHQKKLNLIY